MKITEIQKIYNQNAEEYKTNLQDFSFPWAMFEYFLQYLPWKSILDIGCGFWRDVLITRELWYDAYGVDISESLLWLADDSIQEYLTHGDFSSLKKIYKNTSFDGIFSSASLLHNNKKIVENVVRDSYNLLNDWWLIFISTKTTHKKQSELIHKESISTPWVIKSYYYHAHEEIIQILENVWFRILKTHFWTPRHDSWWIFIAKK